MPKVVDIRKADEPRDVIHEAVHRLAKGELVAFPSETLYFVAASSLKSAAVRRLQEAAARRGHGYLELLVKGPAEAADFLPNMSRTGWKLARRCWPGPVTIAFDVSKQDGLFNALPSEVKHAVTNSAEVWFRAPAHGAVSEVLRLSPAPLVALRENEAHGNGLNTAEGVAQRYGDNVSLIIDDGACRYGQPESVIRIENDDWKLLCSGVVTETTLNRLASEIFLFVCTGNTCRSPLAEGLFRKLLSEKLKCSQDELYDRGYLVTSAGISAAPGAPASPESIEIAAGYGVDLQTHQSQPLTDRLLQQADHIYAMTRGHHEAIVQSHPEVSGRVELLARDQSDIPDPLGGGIEDYEYCEREIERNLRAILDEMELK